jgi:uncharacterized protein YukE
MGTKVDVDIEELERFATQLQLFNKELERIADKVEGQLQNLGSSWRDDQYSKFYAEWNSTFRAIYKYIDQHAPQYVHYLKNQVAKLRDVRR